MQEIGSYNDKELENVSGVLDRTRNRGRIAVPL